MSLSYFRSSFSNLRSWTCTWCLKRENWCHNNVRTMNFTDDANVDIISIFLTLLIHVLKKSSTSTSFPRVPRISTYEVTSHFCYIKIRIVMTRCGSESLFNKGIKIRVVAILEPQRTYILLTCSNVLNILFVIIQIL